MARKWRHGDLVRVRQGAYDAPEIHDGHTGTVVDDRSRPGVCMLRDEPVGEVDRSWYHPTDLEPLVPFDPAELLETAIVLISDDTMWFELGARVHDALVDENATTPTMRVNLLAVRAQGGVPA